MGDACFQLWLKQLKSLQYDCYNLYFHQKCVRVSVIIHFEQYVASVFNFSNSYQYVMALIMVLLYIFKIEIFKYHKIHPFSTIQCFLVYSECCTSIIVTNSRTCQHPRKKPQVSQELLPISLYPQALETLIYLQSIWTCLLQAFCVNRIIQCVAFCV